MRARLLAARVRRPETARQLAAAHLQEGVLGLPELAAAPAVAAYVSLPDEPGTPDLLDALQGRGVRVLLPVLLPDRDLDWAEYRGRADLRPGRRGLLEPGGPRLGPTAVAEAGVVLVPGLAADRAGHRLGRGGGSYDRALARLPAGSLSVVLLFDDELLASVPVEGHDRPVRAALTPSELHRFDRQG